ncbi:MAG: hypothetical protein GYB58_12595 [Gammaproteobacteria bacterium]|nr:hypothetical protein [Gammaproteobacteria bacterium]
MLRYYMIMLTAFAALLTWPVASETGAKKVIVGAQLTGLFHIPGEHEGPGVYHEILQRALVESGLDEQAEIIVMPMSRAKRGFVNKQFACYAPGIATFDLEDVSLELQDVLISVPLNKAMVRVISRDEQHLVRHARDIPNHAVLSIVRGTPLSKEMQQIVDRVTHLFEVSSETENVQMLNDNKVDYIFSFYPDVLFAYEELGMSELPYSMEYSPLTMHDTVICHPGHKPLFKAINQKLEEFARSGVLNQMLGDLNMFTEPQEPGNQ